MPNIDELPEELKLMMFKNQDCSEDVKALSDSCRAMRGTYKQNEAAILESTFDCEVFARLVRYGTVFKMFIDMTPAERTDLKSKCPHMKDLFEAEWSLENANKRRRR